MDSGVYQYSFKTGFKKYIGSSVNLKHRGQCHLAALRSNTHINKEFQHAYCKHGEVNLMYEVLEYVDKSDCDSYYDFKHIILGREQFYLDLYGAQEYISSGDRRFFESLYNKSVLTGYTYTEKRNDIVKPVYQFTLDGVLIDTYDHSHAASSETGIDSASIRKACQGISLTAGGFYWDYSDVYTQKRENRGRRAINQYTIDKVFVRRYETIKAARLATGIDIRKGRNSRSRTHGGFYWLYDNEPFPEFQKIRLTEGQKAEIAQAYLSRFPDGFSYGTSFPFYEEMKKKYNVSYSAVYNIINSAKESGNPHPVHKQAIEEAKIRFNV